MQLALFSTCYGDKNSMLTTNHWLLTKRKLLWMNVPFWHACFCSLVPLFLIASLFFIFLLLTVWYCKLPLLKRKSLLCDSWIRQWMPVTQRMLLTLTISILHILMHLQRILLMMLGLHFLTVITRKCAG